MAKNYNQIALEILRRVGGARNVENALNCMTRLRVTVKSTGAVNESEIAKIDGVIQIIKDDRTYQIVLGPGVAKKVADEFQKLIKLVNVDVTKYEQEEGVGQNLTITDDWQSNKEKIKTKQKRFVRLNRAMKHIANIFAPLIPAVIAAGLFAALASIVNQAAGGAWNAKSTIDPNSLPAATQVFYYLFKAFNTGFTGYIMLACGYNAAKEFGATPMLGLMLGGICLCGEIASIAKIIGLYDAGGGWTNHILDSGKGGVIGIILACLLLSYVEKFIRKRMPNVLDTAFTPFLSILIVGSVYVFGIMIIAGAISDGIGIAIGTMTMNSNVAIRIVVGFIAAALFLPLVMTGMHHGLVAIYSEELLRHGFVSIYPALAMSGAGQVGAAIALYLKAKKLDNKQLIKNISSTIFPGVLGIGEPLIYSVTLPLGIPFLTAGLGAGFGGALVMAFQVGSTSWGPSGLIAIPLMTHINGVPDVGKAMGIYIAGLIISIIMGFIFTLLIVRNKRITPTEASPTEIAFKK